MLFLKYSDMIGGTVNNELRNEDVCEPENGKYVEENDKGNSMDGHMLG